jgi:hypothetical protein
MTYHLAFFSLLFSRTKPDGLDPTTLILCIHSIPKRDCTQVHLVNVCPLKALSRPGRKR